MACLIYCLYSFFSTREKLLIFAGKMLVGLNLMSFKSAEILLQSDQLDHDTLKNIVCMVCRFCIAVCLSAFSFNLVFTTDQFLQ